MTKGRSYKQVRNEAAMKTAYDVNVKKVTTLLEKLTEAIEDDIASSQHAKINWGHVGSMQQYVEDLQDLVDRATGSGEYAS